MVRISVLVTLLIGLFAMAAFAGPPKDVEVASQAFINVVDNGFTTLTFNPQPAGEYYLEMTELIGTIGCWGAKLDYYTDGTAYQDGEIIEGGDFKLLYTPTGGEPIELIVVPGQGAIDDKWFPFGLQEAQESIGQTFIVPEEFVAVAFQTPTWSTADSGCTFTLYAAASASAAEPTGKLTATWGSIKALR